MSKPWDDYKKNKGEKPTQREINQQVNDYISTPGFRAVSAIFIILVVIMFVIYGFLG